MLVQEVRIPETSTFKSLPKNRKAVGVSLSVSERSEYQKIVEILKNGCLGTSNDNGWCTFYFKEEQLPFANLASEIGDISPKEFRFLLSVSRNVYFDFYGDDAWEFTEKLHRYLTGNSTSFQKSDTHLQFHPGEDTRPCLLFIVSNSEYNRTRIVGAKEQNERRLEEALQKINGRETIVCTGKSFDRCLSEAKAKMRERNGEVRLPPRYGETVLRRKGTHR